jgi:hypothetical protein
MENSTTQEKKGLFAKFGKKKKVVIAVIAVLLLVGVVSRGFAFRSAWGNRGQFLMGTSHTLIAAKDFEPLGVVFAETTAGRRNGYGATYDVLMKEAAQKGADTIININISSTRGFFNRTWSGSATAIKYTGTVSGETSVLTGIASTALLTRNERGFIRKRF